MMGISCCSAPSLSSFLVFSLCKMFLCSQIKRCVNHLYVTQWQPGWQEAGRAAAGLVLKPELPLSQALLLQALKPTCWKSHFYKCLMEPQLRRKRCRTSWSLWFPALISASGPTQNPILIRTFLRLLAGVELLGGSFPGFWKGWTDFMHFQVQVKNVIIVKISIIFVTNIRKSQIYNRVKYFKPSFLVILINIHWMKTSKYRNFQHGKSEISSRLVIVWDLLWL